MSVRLGLIGVGRWGKRYLQTIGNMSGVQVTHLCTRHDENSKLVSNPVKIIREWRDLCLPDVVDGVIIATPPHTHFEILKECIQAQIPAMVEKPLCLNLRDALEIQDQLRKKNALVLVDHTQLFQPGYEKLKANFSDPAQIRFIHCEGQSYGPFREDNVSVLWDWGPHDVGLCLDLMRDIPHTVTCFGASSEKLPVECSEMLAIRLEFNSTITAWIQIGRLAAKKQRSISVFGKEKIMVFNDLTDPKLIEYAHGWDQRFEVASNSLRAPLAVSISPEFPLTLAVKEFIEGIHGKPTPKFGVDLAVNVTRVLEAAETSLKKFSKGVALKP